MPYGGTSLTRLFDIYGFWLGLVVARNWGNDGSSLATRWPKGAWLRVARTRELVMASRLPPSPQLRERSNSRIFAIPNTLGGTTVIATLLIKPVLGILVKIELEMFSRVNYVSFLG